MVFPSTATLPRDGLRSGSAVGLLAIEPATRHRVRMNGVVESRDETGFTLRTEQVYSNCPKYIQARDLTAAEPSTSPEDGRQVTRAAALSPGQVDLIATADTFVIATAHPTGGADASHRGGLPGFVRVDDPQTLSFPDYAGNMMFQTLGNLAVDARAGLLFLDFVRGTTLQLARNRRRGLGSGSGGRLPRRPARRPICAGGGGRNGWSHLAALGRPQLLAVQSRLS